MTRLQNYAKSQAIEHLIQVRYLRRFPLSTVWPLPKCLALRADTELAGSPPYVISIPPPAPSGLTRSDRPIATQCLHSAPARNGEASQ